MKTVLTLLLSAAALLLTPGCEMVAHTDDGTVVVNDGTVSSFETQQGHIVVTANNTNYWR